MNVVHAKRKWTHGGLVIVAALAACASNANNVACGSPAGTGVSVDVGGVGRDTAVRGSDGVNVFISGTEAKQCRQYFS